MTDGTARVFIYQGDAAYFETAWGIPAGVEDLDEALDALAEARGFEPAPLLDERLEGRAGVVVRDQPPVRGALYLLRGENGWLLVSASAPEDDFETIVPAC